MWTSRLLGAAALTLVPIGLLPATAQEQELDGAARPRDLVAVYAEWLGISLGDSAASTQPAVAAADAQGPRGAVGASVDVVATRDLGAAPAPAADDAAGGQQLALAAAPLPTGELADMRGGFAMPSGLSVAFGFDIETRLGGAIVQQLTLPQTVLGTGPAPTVQATNAQGVTTAVTLNQSLPTAITDVLNGGATRVTTQIGGGAGIVGVLQNSQGGQTLQRTTTIGIDISGMQGMLNNGAMRSLMQSGLGGRERFGR